MNALYIICGLGIASLIAEIVNLKKWLVLLVTVGLAAAAVVAASDWNTTSSYFYEMVLIDNISIAFAVLICLSAVLWFWLSHDYFKDETHITDQSALVLFALVGAVILTCFNNMSMLFLGIEILSISLYVLAGSKKDSIFSTEAAFKYFLMGSFATGFLLMGIALIYGATGTFDLIKISQFTADHHSTLPGFFFAGVLLVMVGMAFKVSAVPFHFWAPDVYQGSPLAITAFMSTIVKIAAFSAFLRLFLNCFSVVQNTWLFTLQAIAISTMIVSSITAVYQSNIKRLLAYSSVGHAGYVLLALVTGNEDANGVIFYYLLTYSASSLLAFAVLTQLEKSDSDISLTDLKGLFKSSPILAVGFTIALLSMAGIPPLAGFIGKYLVLNLALSVGYIGFVIVAIITSLVGVYYYFKLIISMFQDAPDAKQQSISISTRLLIYVLVGLVLLAGILPNVFQVI
jgi:NADH-quinone oxidoreductase subunit N